MRSKAGSESIPTSRSFCLVTRMARLKPLTNSVCATFRTFPKTTGTKLLRGLFEPAEEMARYDRLCYINCDIMLLPTFGAAVERVAARFPQFLMVGQRWDTDIFEPWDFGPNWDLETGSTCGPTRLSGRAPRDPLFRVCPRAFSRHTPARHRANLVGSLAHLCSARSLKPPVVDATLTVRAVHQNHDYSYHPAGATGVWQDEQARRNYELAGGKWHLYTIDDSTHRLTPAGLKRKMWYPLAPLRRALRPVCRSHVVQIPEFTQPVRHPLGIRRKV